MVNKFIFIAIFVVALISLIANANARSFNNQVFPNDFVLGVERVFYAYNIDYGQQIFEDLDINRNDINSAITSGLEQHFSSLREVGPAKIGGVSVNFEEHPEALRIDFSLSFHELKNGDGKYLLIIKADFSRYAPFRMKSLPVAWPIYVNPENTDVAVHQIEEVVVRFTRSFAHQLICGSKRWISLSPECQVRPIPYTVDANFEPRAKREPVKQLARSDKTYMIYVGVAFLFLLIGFFIGRKSIAKAEY